MEDSIRKQEGALLLGLFLLFLALRKDFKVFLRIPQRNTDRRERIFYLDIFLTFYEGAASFLLSLYTVIVKGLPLFLSTNYIILIC